VILGPIPNANPYPPTVKIAPKTSNAQSAVSEIRQILKRVHLVEDDAHGVQVDEKHHQETALQNRHHCNTETGAIRQVVQIFKGTV
jgi:rRNA maturation protein Rpf1